MKGIEVANVIRVACPASGTILLSDRIDHFLNGILNLIGAAFGSKANIYYQCVQEFLMAVIAQKEKADGIPGLWAMVPGSDYQKVNNNRLTEVKCKTYVIAGDSEIGGGFLNSLKVIFSNLFYRVANDFVVNTKSMSLGIKRADGIYKYLSQDNKTSHFNYFKNTNTSAAILAAINLKTSFEFDGKTIEFELVSKFSTDRGIALKAAGFKPYNSNQISGNKPIVVLIPGIMGSTLKNGEDIWFDIGEIAKGNLVNKLKIDKNNAVTPSGIIDRYYKDFAEFLKKDFDVYTFAYDWRISLSDSAQALKSLLEKLQSHNQPVKIVAHSMGGLVVKNLMLSEELFWNNFIRKETSKLIMLGTPWLGSYLIMEVLTGHSSRIGQLSFLDFSHSKKEILNTVGKFQGLWELLPIDNTPFETKAFWDDIHAYEEGMAPIDETMLRIFDKYKKDQIAASFENIKFNNVYYLAGHDKTVCFYEKKKSFFGDAIKYQTTNLGDGSVTYDLGIPKEVKPENLYYCPVNHTNLAGEEKNFEGLRDLLMNGKTFRFDQEAPVSRSGEIIEFRSVSTAFSSEEEDAINTIFDVPSINEVDSIQSNPIKVSVLNADLKYANFAVMVGHFENDGMYSGEKALNRYLNNKLGERHRLGFYPGQIGESEITYNKKSQPNGALVVGMGKPDEITPHRLSVTIEKAVIKYAFFFRDNYEDVEIKRKGCGISSLLIGSSYAGIPIEDCIKSILLGVHRANLKIVQLDNGLMPIKEIQFIDYYEDLAQYAYKALRQINDNQTNFNIIVGELTTYTGNKRRIQYNDNASWWHSFTTIGKYNESYEPKDKRVPTGLTFSSSGNKARVEQDNVGSDLRMVEFLSKEFSHLEKWDPKLAKTMFELLVPNDFKSIIRNQSNILWKMDEYAAQFPWEMFHDYNYGDEPTFINTGLIRQLYATDYRVNPTIVDDMTALVVGDPQYNGKYPQLPGAVAEANAVIEELTKAEYNIKICINSTASDIVKEMYSLDYKILHFAAHGVHDENNSGIVIGPDIFLTPGTINQLSSIPEFIFINCCFSGDMTQYGDQFFKERNKLASNIGTQLIKMGVKAAIVCGWAVNDAAAKVFAQEFYARMLEGYEFGSAVQKARRKCYDLNKNSNTWGAYQCYGDHYYRMVNKNPLWDSNENFYQEIEAQVELENLLSVLKGQKVNISKKVKNLEWLIEKIIRSNVNGPVVKELTSKAYAELGQYDKSIEILYDLLFEEKADFNVSSLEQYCSLRGKQLVQQYRKLPAPDDVTEKEKSRVDKTMKNLKTRLAKIYEDLAFIIKIGPTAERFALIGSANKCGYLIDRTNGTGHLTGIKDNFFKSYTMLKNESVVKYFYPLSNYLIAAYCLKKDFKEIKSELNIVHKDSKDYFGYLQKLIDKDIANFKDYYTKNANAKLQLVKMLYLDSGNKNFGKDLKLLEKDILISLTESIRNYANMKQIQGEIEHLEFLKDIVQNDAKETVMGNIIQEIKGELDYEE